ncbi:ATPase [Pseudoxanthomonas yeongjuensis]|uniref:SRPBCC family protein n=1 Tax=Pseudoxanthomonas yeongjuensis TaxID=377616 RepID=UPI0013909D25|nr:SRPBCC family protein [Pseudoxanthomonas yeongjuensis]KAF1717716.1 ATPase [Pseudoxanthomonas yeongjuensis]
MNTAYATLVAADTVRFERILPGPVERVWAFLTESDKRAQWLAAGEMELREGGSVELVFRNSELTANDDPPPEKYARYGAESRMHGRIIACEPPRLLAYTWDGTSEVRFELSAQGDEVRLLLTHTRLPDREQMLSVAGGWHTHLDILVDRLDGRMSPGFWTTHTRLEAEYAQRIP